MAWQPPTVTCTAKSSRTGERCRRAPVRGLKVCRSHGGASQRARAAGKRRDAEARALKALERLDVAPLGNPVDELVELAAKIKAITQRLESRVADLERLHTWGEQGEQIKAEVALWERFTDRSRGILVDLARLNLDERLVRVTEAQGALILRVIEGVLSDLGVDPDEDRAAEALDRHLRLVASA